MVGSIPHIWFGLNFFTISIRICYSCFQIFELCHIFKLSVRHRNFIRYNDVLQSRDETTRTNSFQHLLLDQLRY
jgi:hypothetical protein